MYKCSDIRAQTIMEEHHIGGEYYTDEYSDNLCSKCGNLIDSCDDLYIYDERPLCTDCLKNELFDEFSDDYRLKQYT